jgi:hypothetical protein
MWIFMVIFAVCYALASWDTTNEKPVDKPHISLREDMEFADLVSKYLRGEEL